MVHYTDIDVEENEIGEAGVAKLGDCVRSSATDMPAGVDAGHLSLSKRIHKCQYHSCGKKYNLFHVTLIYIIMYMQI